MSHSITWIDWFLSQPYGQIFCRIDQEFLKSHLNDGDIISQFTNYKQAIDIVLSRSFRPKDNPRIENDAVNIYGLLHAKFLETEAGLRSILKKREETVFMKCPRYLCYKCTCIPIGIPSKFGKTGLFMYCPNCGDVYAPNDPVTRKIDGGYFGSRYVKKMLKSHPEITPNHEPEVHIPKIFGFDLAKAKK